jgi:hypothetical protein
MAAMAWLWSYMVEGKKQRDFGGKIAAQALCRKA